MKYADIERIYTEMIQTRINEGCTINSETMGGSQGELARIDLRDGDLIQRVYMNKTYDHETMLDVVEIIVGVTSLARGRGILWNDKLEVIEKRNFMRIGFGNWYTEDRDEARNAQNVTIKRAKQRGKMRALGLKRFGKEGIKVALPIIRKRIGQKTTKIEEVAELYHNTYTGEYFCDARGRTMRLNHNDK